MWLKFNSSQEFKCLFIGWLVFRIVEFGQNSEAESFNFYSLTYEVTVWKALSQPWILDVGIVSNFQYSWSIKLGNKTYFHYITSFQSINSDRKKLDCYVIKVIFSKLRICLEVTVCRF